MSIGLFIALLLFIIIGAVSAFLVKEFVLAKDGKLRKLMIFHFIAQFWVVFVSGTFFYFKSRGVDLFDFWTVGNIALSPLALSLFLIWYYLTRRRQIGKRELFKK